MHFKVNTCHLYPTNDLFPILGWSWPPFDHPELVYRTLQQILLLFCFFCFSCFSMDKIKASQLRNWELLFPTHSPLVFLHFLGLACFFSISLTNHSCFFQLVRSLIDLGSALATYGGLLYFGKSIFLSFMSCFHTIRFSYEDVLFMYTIVNHYWIKWYTSIFISSFMWFSLFSPLYFSCVCLW